MRETIAQALKTALKSQDKRRTSTLRLVNAAITTIASTRWVVTTTVGRSRTTANPPTTAWAKIRTKMPAARREMTGSARRRS